MLSRYYTFDNQYSLLTVHYTKFTFKIKDLSSLDVK